MSEIIYIDPQESGCRLVAELSMKNLFLEESRLPCVELPNIPDIMRIKLAGEEVPLLVVLQLGLEKIEPAFDKREGVKVPHLFWQATMLPTGMKEMILRMQIRDTAGPRYLIKQFLSSLSYLPVGKGARAVIFFGLKENGSDFEFCDWSSLDGVRRAEEKNFRLNPHPQRLVWTNWFRSFFGKPPLVIPGLVDIPDNVPVSDPWHSEQFQPVVVEAVKQFLKPALESLFHQLLRTPEVLVQLEKKRFPLEQIAFTRLETEIIQSSLKEARSYTRLF